MINTKGDELLLSVSGGKDSTAMILHMKEILIDRSKLNYVFMDTGWESKETYTYLKYLEDNLNIEISRIRAKVQIKAEHKETYEKCLKLMNRNHSDFVATILNKTMFPAGAFQWCTSILKIDPFKDFLKDLDYQAISCVGIRKEESKRRSNYLEWEFNEGFDCWVWRPLIDWTESQVIEIHARHNIKPNPLYLKGSHRVGCFPCIKSNKKEMKEFPRTHEQIEVIKLLEEYNSKIKGRQMTFFKGGTIEQVLEWSRTSRGGKQYFLFDTTEPTCQKWGMCGI